MLIYLNLVRFFHQKSIITNAKVIRRVLAKEKRKLFSAQLVSIELHDCSKKRLK